MKATGGPEAGMAHFAAATPGELAALAWSLEIGSRRFYAALERRFSSDRQARDLFGALSRAEEDHQRVLEELHRQAAGGGSLESSLAGLGERPGELMEGGVGVLEALGWIGKEEPDEAVALAMGLEINSYDLYLKMSRKMEAGEEKDLFAGLAREEQRHLERLGPLLESFLDR